MSLKGRGCTSLHPAAWNIPVMAEVLATTLDHEDQAVSRSVNWEEPGSHITLLHYPRTLGCQFPDIFGCEREINF